jgi:hypothetical protein
MQGGDDAGADGAGREGLPVLPVPHAGQGGAAACPAPQLSADKVETMVANRLRRLGLDDELREEVIAAAKAQVALERKAGGAISTAAGGAADVAEVREALVGSGSRPVRVHEPRDTMCFAR